MNHKKQHAFTLIELMVVVTIIGILIAILLPVIGAVMTSGEKAKARAEVAALETAIRKYYDDYNTFPPNTGEPGKDVTKDLVDLLAGKNVGEKNPREKMYMEYNPGSIKGGNFVDPWGYPYKVSTDTNLDNLNGTGQVPRKVLVWSGGPDGIADQDGKGSEKDNVASW